MKKFTSIKQTISAQIPKTIFKTNKNHYGIKKKRYYDEIKNVN